MKLISAMEVQMYKLDAFARMRMQEPIGTSAANRLVGEVVQSRRRPLLGPSPG